MEPLNAVVQIGNYILNEYNILLNLHINSIFLLDLSNIVLIVVIFLLFYNKFFSDTVPIKNLELFLDKTDELANKGDYSTVISLIKENYNQIMRFEDNYKTSEQMFLDAMDESENELNNEDDAIGILLERFQNRLSSFKFVKQIVKLDPYLGLKIATDKKIDQFFADEFAELYFEELIKSENTVFYREIEKTQDLVYRYKISKSNKILHTILSDVGIADNIRIPRFISAQTIDVLVNQGKKSRDFYNDYNKNFEPGSNKLYRDKVFIGIRFFDIMVREAIYQEYGWHMLLTEYNRFVESICENYKLGANSNSSKEFPTAYSFFLYEIIGNLRSWIMLIERDKKHLKIKAKKIDCEHEPDNIIKSSAICLAYCIEKIFTSDNIPFEFKNYLFEMILNLYFDLKLSSNSLSQEYGQIFLGCILKDASNDKYKNSLIELLNHNRTEIIIKRGVKAFNELMSSIKKA